MTYKRPTDCSKNLKAWLHRTCTCGRENSKRSSSREGRHLGPRWPLIAPLFPWYACQASCWLLRARCSVFRLQERYRGGPLHLTSIRLRTQSLSWIGQRWCFFFFFFLVLREQEWAGMLKDGEGKHHFAGVLGEELAFDMKLGPFQEEKLHVRIHTKWCAVYKRLPERPFRRTVNN